MKAYLLSRPSDLKPAAVLGAHRPHGHKMRYMAGCRCAPCRRANSDYNKALMRNSQMYGPNDLVSTAPVRRFLLAMQKLHVGHKTIGKHTGVGKTSLAEILWYGKKWMRRRKANAVLAYKPTLDTMPLKGGCLLPAGDTVKKLHQLVQWGIPRYIVSRDGLNQSSPAIQIPAFEGRATTVCVKTARSVRNYFAAVVQIRAEWVAQNGRIPARHFVYWKKGTDGPTELRPFAITYDYANTYSAELREVMRLRHKVRDKYRAMKRARKKVAA